MASIVTIENRLKVEDSDGNSQDFGTPVRFAMGVSSDSSDIRAVSLTGSAFTALTVPTGAKAVRIWLPATAVSLTLKGVTGDTGIAITPSSNFLGLPVTLPLGSSPSIGILNGGSTLSVRVQFL
jgi:hypothetical protein